MTSSLFQRIQVIAHRVSSKLDTVMKRIDKTRTADTVVVSSVLVFIKLIISHACMHTLEHTHTHKRSIKF